MWFGYESLPKSSSGFKLSLVQLLDTTTDDFSHVGTSVNRNDEDSSQCAIKVDTESLGSSIVDINHRLNDHWRTTENFNPVNIRRIQPTSFWVGWQIAFILQRGGAVRKTPMASPIMRPVIVPDDRD